MPQWTNERRVLTWFEDNSGVVTWFKDHGICKLRINYSIAYPKPQNKRYCSQYMIAIVVLKPSYMAIMYCEQYLLFHSFV